MMSKGEIIAALVALGFAKDSGPMSGEDPILRGNEVILESQCPSCGYRFNDDGSIDCFYPDPEAMYDSLVNDWEEDEEEAREEVDNPASYENIEELCSGIDGWFGDFENSNPGLYNAIKEVVAFVPKRDRDD